MLRAHELEVLRAVSIRCDARRSAVAVVADDLIGRGEWRRSVPLVVMPRRAVRKDLAHLARKGLLEEVAEGRYALTAAGVATVSAEHATQVLSPTGPRRGETAATSQDRATDPSERQATSDPARDPAPPLDAA